MAGGRGARLNYPRPRSAPAGRSRDVTALTLRACTDSGDDADGDDVRGVRDCSHVTDDKVAGFPPLVRVVLGVRLVTMHGFLESNQELIVTGRGCFRHLN